MKDYGNLVNKYVSKKASSKYKPILAKNLLDYQKAQLADLRKFLKEDFKIAVNRDNQSDYARNVNNQKKEIEAEISRLKGQIPQSS